MPEKRKILFYYEVNKYSNSLITYLSLLKEKGHEVLALITAEWGPLHDALQAKGIPVYVYTANKTNSIIFYLKHIFNLVRFVLKHKVTTVHSHVQRPNFIATIASLFVPVKLVAFRHHYRPFGIKANWKEKFFDWVIHTFAPIVVVPSKTVKEGIVKYEKRNSKKILVVRYIYDFSKYPKPSTEKVENIKKQFPARLRLLMVSRLIPLKRPMLVFSVVKELVQSGFDIRLLVAGEGPMRPQLENWIMKHDLSDRIILLGFKTDLVNYMAASDMLVSASMTDASNSAAKEMGLLGKLVAVPDYVGDFTEYIIDGCNGFLLPLENTEEKLKEVIRNVYENPENYKDMGIRLRDAVLKRFDYRYAKEVVKLYEKLV
ncbi:MAG: glycosyltransferase family 4 protein [Chlorobi bacterium]|nr:glycosyltransferase family 4 protein [Chlorobiota bacterium]